MKHRPIRLVLILILITYAGAAEAGYLFVSGTERTCPLQSRPAVPPCHGGTTPDTESCPVAPCCCLKETAPSAQATSILQPLPKSDGVPLEGTMAPVPGRLFTERYVILVQAEWGRCVPLYLRKSVLLI